MGKTRYNSPRKDRIEQNSQPKDLPNQSNIIIIKQNIQSKDSPNPRTLIKEEEELKVPEIKLYNGELDIKNESF